MTAQLYPPLPLQPGKSGAGKRVCIATSDIVGPIRNGGIGTHYTTLAETLAKAGHTVTLLYTLGDYYENKDEAYWRKHFAAKAITFIPVPEVTDVRVDAAPYVAKPYATYRWLAERQDQFDIIHFHEWRGYSFYCVLAKQQGLAFQNVTLCVGTHSPTLWLKAGNFEFTDQLSFYELDHMERTSVALADIVHSPSHYMLDWMKAEGWRLPERCYVQPYILPHAARLNEASRQAETQHVNELVFFGRLEARKGLILFCDALDRLAGSGLQFTVSFLGKLAQVKGTGSAEYIAQRAAKWPWQWRIINDKDQPGAMRYLRGGGRLAVMPSLLDNLPLTVLECLGAQIPFIAGAVGGIPEMVAPESAATALFPLRAEALADRIRSCVENGARPPQPSVAFEANEQAWIDWHARLESPPPAAPATEQPLVSVCLVTHNRPQYLRQALESLRRQDYPNFEVVLVDDGSTQPEHLDYLDELEPKFATRGWQLVRQPNRYLGAARNTAARHARGEYLLFMDDDNLAKPHELSTFVRAAQHSRAGIVTCFMDCFSGEARPGPNAKPDRRWLFLGGAAAVGAFWNCYGDANSLVRKSVFESVGGFTEDYGITHEDWEFLAQAVLRGHTLTVVPEALFWYRVSAGGMLRSTNYYANTMRHLRPFANAVPESLRPLVYFAQAVKETADAAIGGAQYAQSMLQIQQAFTPVVAALGGAEALLRLGLEKPGMEKIWQALEAARKTGHPAVIANGLLEAGELLLHLNLKAAGVPMIEEAHSVAVQYGLEAEKQRAAQRLNGTTSIVHPPRPQATPARTAHEAAVATLERLIESNDLPATLAAAEAEGALTPELVALVQHNARMARADGDAELAGGLETLAAFISDRITVPTT